MEKNDNIYVGEAIVRGNVFMTQLANGKVEVRRGSPTNPGQVIWENGIDDSNEYSYLTKFQGDGHLITWRIDSNGYQLPIWRSYTVYPGDSFFFVVECEENGGGVAIYHKDPNNDWLLQHSWDPIPSPPTTPPSEAASFAPSACKEQILLERDDVIYQGESLLADDVYLEQNSNGNLEVRRGNPDDPGDVVWESGQTGSTMNSYHSILQGDGNLITWKVFDGVKSLHWKSDTSEENGFFYFLLECPSAGGVLTIYRGLPSEGGQVIKSWKEVSPSNLPSSSPSRPASFSPSKNPSKSPSKPPSNHPSSSPSFKPSETPCEDRIFLETNDVILRDESIVRNNMFLFQADDGNLEIRQGTPEEPGYLVWESNVKKRRKSDYSTKLHENGNLITSKEKNGNQIWESGTSSEDAQYYFLLECLDRGGHVAIYKGLPDQDGVVLMSWEANSTPIQNPTKYPSTSPTSRPSRSPFVFPSAYPSISPSSDPSPRPSMSPSISPSFSPTLSHILGPSPTPSAQPSPISTDCASSIFLERDDVIGEGVEIVRNDHFLYQKTDGNLEIRVGTLDNPGELVWESGKTGSYDSYYYTKLQGDGNLITWHIMDGNQTILWKSDSVESNGLYFFGLDCGGAVAISNQGGQPIKSWSTLPRISPPTSEPSNVPSQYPTICHDYTVFLERDEYIDEGESIVRNNFYLFQRFDGNLEIRETGSGDLVWQSGVENSDYSRYYSKLQGDGHLITWGVDSVGNRAPVFRTFELRENGDFFFLLECPGQGGKVAVYEGDPTKGGSAIWTNGTSQATRRILRSRRI